MYFIYLAKYIIRESFYKARPINDTKIDLVWVLNTNTKRHSLASKKILEYYCAQLAKILALF
jgi:hypothetical protein